MTTKTNESRLKIDPAGHGGSPQLSMRVACDRCRMLKLKCCAAIGATESCQRCTKARVTCVYGRRERANKRRRVSEHYSASGGEETVCSPSQLGDNDIADTAAIPPVGTSSVANHDIRSPEAGGSPGALATLTPLSLLSCQIMAEDRLFPQCDGNGLLEGVADLGPGSLADVPFLELEGYDPATLWGASDADNDEMVSGEKDIDYSVEDSCIGMHCSATAASYGQIGLRSSAADVSPSGRTHARERRISGVTPAGPAQQWSGVGRITELQSSTHASVSHELLGLVTRIQQQLSRLENGPWRKDSTKNLDDYPVGYIIQLAKKLAHVAEAVFGQDEATADSISLNFRPSPASIYNSTSLDTPSALLLLCGYTWLTRLYNVVLDHFQSHVSRISITVGQSQQSPHSFLASTLCDPELKLGEFPCVSSLLELHRIYAAIGSLCDALKSVEYQLGSGGIELRDTASAALQNWDDGHNSNFNSIEKRTTLMKLQLRDKIGF